MSLLIRNFKIFYFYGLSPFHEQVLPYSLIKWVTLAGLFHNVIPQIIYLYVHRGSDIQNLTTAFGELIFTFRTFSLLVVIILRFERLRALTVALIDFANLRQKEDKNGNFNKRTNFTKWFPKFYYLAGSVMIVNICLIQASVQTYLFFNGLATEDTFILPAHTDFLSFSQSPIVYQICFVTSSMSHIIGTFVAASMDILFAGFCVVYEALYYCLAANYNELDSIYSEQPNLLPETGAMFRRSMKHLIAHHGDTIELLTEFNDIMKPIVLIQYYSAMILLAVILFLTSDVPLFSYLFVFYLGTFWVTTLQLFIYCRSGSNIVKACEQFFAELNNGHWYNYPMWAKKYMVSVIMVAGRDVTLKIGESVTCDMVTVWKVLQAGYSGFSLLRSMKK